MLPNVPFRYFLFFIHSFLSAQGHLLRHHQQEVRPNLMGIDFLLCVYLPMLHIFGYRTFGYCMVRVGDWLKTEACFCLISLSQNGRPLTVLL